MDIQATSPAESLHSEILFHFTTKDALYDILESYFRVSYARERIEGRKESREYGVPMVSFCDLKLSEVKSHMAKYGNYGIGMTKEWATRNGLSPVWYISKNCEFTDNFISAIQQIYRKLNSIDDHREAVEFGVAYSNLLDTYRYVKNYEGRLSRKGKPDIEKYRFADEREWRYVLPISDSGNFPFMPMNQLRTLEQKKIANKSIENHRLNFSPSDIKYLIIDNDDEINELVKHLRRVKSRFDKHEIDKLLCRILSAEQIFQDI